MVTARLKPANKKLKKFNEIESPKLKFKEKLAYGFGDLGNGLMFDMGQIYLLLFIQIFWEFRLPLVVSYF